MQNTDMFKEQYEKFIALITKVVKNISLYRLSIYGNQGSILTDVPLAAALVVVGILIIFVPKLTAISALFALFKQIKVEIT
ncbi:DUF4342 domain-containing protein [Candidatus Nitrosacidococcus tergens]|uniref:DUF4342 domain-containing protein n=1 Tax=Candidatus Nitrosacidococcus tergens TaxID=553981 RepID=A0A7G1Q9J9_9GAMM|nr:DUF4342 domain-containing protein [Candidatus Nitrosacidococcus tergens]CAB1275989.1 conserved protein of unknown function [Candidatus Nitrosacidococcus tergens]